jgi:hypothetical protein
MVIVTKETGVPDVLYGVLTFLSLRLPKHHSENQVGF